MKNRRPGVVVAGLHSGSGKTLVTLALLQGLQKRGYVVRPFKCGPDFIDPRFHEWISGRTSVNLDPFFLSSGDIQALYDRMTEGLSGGVAEGVMGFYDGLAKKTSTYDLARILDLPVLLAVHSKGIAETLASVVKGVRDHRPDSRLAGIIAVQTGSPKHGEILSRALEEEGLPPLLGTLPRDENLKLPERHLGLVDVRELERSGQLGSLSQQLEHFSSNWHWEKSESSSTDPLVNLFPVAPIHPIPLFLARSGPEIKRNFVWEWPGTALSVSIIRKTGLRWRAGGSKLSPFRLSRIPSCRKSWTGFIWAEDIPSIFWKNSPKIFPSWKVFGASMQAEDSSMPNAAECCI